MTPPFLTIPITLALSPLASIDSMTQPMEEEERGDGYRNNQSRAGPIEYVFAAPARRWYNEMRWTRDRPSSERRWEVRNSASFFCYCKS